MCVCVKHTKELISTLKTSHKHINKGLSRVTYLACLHIFIQEVHIIYITTNTFTQFFRVPCVDARALPCLVMMMS